MPPKSTSQNLKPSNPKDIIGAAKLPLHLFPVSAISYGTLGLLDGMLKYGRSNWRAVGIRKSIYIDALLRHTYAYLEGETHDPDSGVHHLGHILACAAILVDSIEAGNATDDRLLPTNFRQMMDSLKPEVARLQKLHKDKSPYHYSIADGE